METLDIKNITDIKNIPNLCSQLNIFLKYKLNIFLKYKSTEQNPIINQANIDSFIKLFDKISEI